MKILPRGSRVLAPVVILLAMNIGCGRSPSPAQGAHNQNSAAQASQPQSTQGLQNESVTSAAQYAESAPPVQAKPSPQQAAQQAPQQATITVPSGARLVVRTSQPINVKHAFSGERFAGTVVEPVVVGGSVAIPVGSAATGKVISARRRGRFKGRSVLALTLTRLEVHGAAYRIETSDLTRTKKGKGKRTAAMIGGGAGLGMLVGGVATGGVGLLVGGLAGGGAGTLTSAFTGNRDIVIPAESVVSFRLENSLTLTPAAQQSEAR